MMGESGVIIIGNIIIIISKQLLVLLKVNY